MHKTSSYTFRLWGTTHFRSIQKDTPHKIILGIIPFRGPKTNSRDNKKNFDKEKIDRQLP